MSSSRTFFLDILDFYLRQLARFSRTKLHNGNIHQWERRLCTSSTTVRILEPNRSISTGESVKEQITSSDIRPETDLKKHVATETIFLWRVQFDDCSTTQLCMDKLSLERNAASKPNANRNLPPITLLQRKRNVSTDRYLSDTIWNMQ